MTAELISQNATEQEVLVVDDQPANIRLLTDLLTQSGYRVKGAPGGKWALKSLSGTLPDLILLDIKMPDMDGFEVCRRLKEDERTRDIPVIFISALDSVEDKVAAFEAGGIDYVSKPFENAEVLARVRTHLQLSLLRKQLEEEIARRKQYESQLIQQSKTAAMGEMMGVITHQWRHPLNAIGLYAQEIEDVIEFDACDKKEMNDIRQGILQQIKHMNTTIVDFREFFKPSKEMVDFRACELAVDTYRLVEAKMKKLEIEFISHDHEHFTVHGYPNELKHVFLNIYNNACDAFEERETKRPRRIELFFEQDDRTGIVRIRDNAGGIPEELLPEKLFESYISTKGSKGTGIGMHIAKTVVEEKLHGSISAVNVTGGAEFVIELPLAKRPA